MTKSLVPSDEEIVKDLTKEFTRLCSRIGETEVTVKVQISMLRNHFHLVFQNTSVNSSNLQRIKETFKACGGTITICLYPPLNNLSLHGTAKSFYECLYEIDQPSIQHTARNTSVIQ